MPNVPHWTEEWQRIAAHIAARRQLLLCCNFDAALAPDQADPRNVAVPDEVRSLLRKLSVTRGVSVGIFSGRKIADVRARIDIDGAFYCGNHGLEIEGPG